MNTMHFMYLLVVIGLFGSIYNVNEFSGRAKDLEEIQDEDTSPSKITSEIPIEVEGFKQPHEEEALVHTSERPHRAPNRLCLNVEVEGHSLGDLNEPANYKAAMLDPESNKWLDAMNAEIKWLFKKKTDMDGNVHTYKARLVEKGFTQTYRVDYEETFLPVADIRAIRILIAIVVFYDYEIWQMDIKSSFLNGYLDEDIYMVKPEGFIDPKHPRKASGSNVIFLILYVNDIIVMGNHILSLQSVKEYLGALTPGEVKHMQNVPYASIVAFIMYAVRCTRPDVAFAQNITSRFQQNLVYGGNPEAELRVDCYCDAGFETNKD
nr:hypothetical protein [Tanacetum cinerariifolium]